MTVIVLIVAFLILVAIGVPIAYAIGASSLLCLGLFRPEFVGVLPQRVWSGTNSFVIIALPLFVLAGELMNYGGITNRIIKFCMYLVRPFRGGLGEVNVVASMIFGGISGSSVADTSALGSVLIPQMEKQGYPRGVAAGITVASSTMGMIIPPSIPMLMYAMASGESVGALFLAGLIPGILIGLSQIIVVFMYSKKRGYHPKRVAFDKKDFIHTMLDGSLAIIMPIIIVVSVSTGLATASESAGVAVLYAFILGIFVYKELKIKDIYKILKKTVLTSSSIMIIVGFSMIFSWILSVEQVPQLVADLFLNSGLNSTVILIILVLIILFIGTFIDVAPAILMLVPILMPVMSFIGVSGLQFGAIMITGCAIGLVTPPVGMCLNACTKVCDMPIMDIFKSAIPFILCNIVVLLLVVFVPAISTWLPSLMFTV
jgi:tripartite ATP-independent transporter DctM subunit